MSEWKRRLLGGAAYMMAPDGEGAGGAAAKEGEENGEKDDGAGAEGEAGGSGESGEGASNGEGAPVKAKGWEIERIDKLTKNWREAERSADFWKEVAEGKRAHPDPQFAQSAGTTASSASQPSQSRTSMKDLIEEAAAAKAEEIVAQKEFAKNSEAAVKAGRDTFGKDEFDEAVRALHVVAGDKPGENQAYLLMLSTALDSGEGPRLIYELGKDQELAWKLLNLPPTKMIMEITKMALKKPAGRKESKAPEPHAKVAGGKAQEEDSSPSPKDDMASWLKKREKEIEERNKAYQ